jgi:hypothetical protein
VGAPAAAGLLSLAALSMAYAADPLRVWAGLDVDRHVWMQSDPCVKEALVEAMPGLAAPAGSCAGLPTPSDTASVKAALTTRYHNLIRKPGTPGFALEEARSVVEARLRLPRALELHVAGEGARARRSLGDSSWRLAADPASPSWTARGSLAYTGLPLLVPVIAAGGGTDGSRELALGGRVRVGPVALAAAGGWKRLDLPLTVDLPDYRPLTLPLMLRRNFQAASLEAGLEKINLYVMSRFFQDKHPGAFAEPYSLSDSGSGAEHFAGAAWTDSGSAGRYRLSVEGARFDGRSTFRGTRSGPEGPYQFAYEETRQRNAWARADVRMGGPRREAGIFAGWGAVRWDAFRPAVAAGHHFWDRNGVLDSYEGGLLDVFSQETFLFDGRAGLNRKTAGGWVSFPAASWRLRLALAYHRVEMEAYGRLTRKSTTLLIAYTERDYFLDFHGVEADLLAPEIRLSRRFGKLFVEGSVEQALPFRVRMRRPEGSSGDESRPPSSSASTGGTLAWARVGWGFP